MLARFGNHPIVQAKIVMSCMNVLTANLIIYQIGKRLLENDAKKADLMVVFTCMLQLFCGTLYSSGTFFFTRCYEGKAILANIAIPTVLMCAIWYLQEKDNRNVWIILFITAISALTFSGSAIIFPVATNIFVHGISFGQNRIIIYDRIFRNYSASASYALVCFHDHIILLSFPHHVRTTNILCVYDRRLYYTRGYGRSGGGYGC